MTDLLIGFLLSSVISFGAYKKKSLSFSGFMGAIVLGTSIYFFGGFYLFIIMIAFFISSSLLTKFKKRDKDFLEDIHEKSGQRDYIQVIANGGLGFVYSLLYYVTRNPIFIVAYATIFAAANADTWASELGVLSKAPPISILTFKKAESGSSGAISPLGTLSALLGSLLIAIIFSIGYLLTFHTGSEVLLYFSMVFISGFLGSIIDSLLGASLQGKYQCGVCKQYTEKKTHHQTHTLHISGWQWINNDVVNFASGLLSSALVLSSCYLLS